MDLLLDTCTFLWLVTNSPRLTPTVKAAFADPNNTVWLSVASAWEIAIKHAAGRVDLPSPPDVFVQSERQRHGIDSLALTEEAAVHPALLPLLHADPFDRVLVSQAIVHSLVMVTPDPQIHRYGIRTLW